MNQVLSNPSRLYHNIVNRKVYCSIQMLHKQLGKISLQFDDNGIGDGIGDGIDMITLVGHKFDAPKGIACLYVKPGCFTSKNLVEPSRYMILGGGQEDWKRSGTENVPYIVAMGTAADILMEEVKEEEKTNNQQQQQQSKEEEVILLQQQWQKNANWMKLMRNRLYQGLIDGLGGVNNVRDNGPIDDKNKLPNTLNVGLRNINSSEMLLNIQDRVACSAGRACHATTTPTTTTEGSNSSNIKIISPVLRAMNVPIEYAIGTLRLSVGPTTTKNEIDQAIDIIVNEAKRQLKNLKQQQQQQQK